MSIWNFIIKAVKETKAVPFLGTTFVVILAIAYMIYQQSLLMQADLDIKSTVVSLFWYAVIERFLKASNELIVAYFIMLPFSLVVERLLVEDLVAFSPSSLLLMKENTVALKNSAFRAIRSLVENGLSVITPIVLLVSRSAALSATLDGMQLLIVITSIPSTRHDVIMAILYGFLEIATTGVPVALVWSLKGEEAFLPLYIIIQPMFWNTWYLFWTVKSLVVSTAPWAQYAEFRANSEPPPKDLIKPKSSSEMMKIFNNPEITEIELAGPSGCGKTTLMKKIIAEICSKFILGYILYIDQFACLPLGLNIIEYYSSAFSKGNTPENFEEKLLHHADLLGIENIINKDTLHKPFSNPSGGEKKRIVFLKCVLPILLDSSTVMIAFLDEVSAGLDAVSFAKVRIMIEEMKTKGVNVVSIDHHEHNGINSLKAEVFKEICKVHRRNRNITMMI